LYFNREPEKAEALTEKTYVPNGTTALYDAIFKTCRRIESGIKEINRQEDTTVVVVILTDGYENASQTASLNDVKKMIAELENTGRWTFNFLGATLDAVEVAESMNIKRKNSMAFSKKEIKGKVFARMTSYMEDYVSEKEKMMKENKSLKDININFNKDEE
jgi:Mg-chelatase subunit ChlD